MTQEFDYGDSVRCTGQSGDVYIGFVVRLSDWYETYLRPKYVVRSKSTDTKHSSLITFNRSRIISRRIVLIEKNKPFWKWKIR